LFSENPNFGQTQETDFGKWDPNIMDYPENDDKIFDLRIKVIMNRIE